MAPVRKYQPHCPASGCFGGHAARLHEISLEQLKEMGIPQAILGRKRDTDEQIRRCSYCGLVWFQNSKSRPGFDPLPLGHYDNVHFVPVFNTFRIREENKPNYLSKQPWRNRKKAKG